MYKVQPKGINIKDNERIVKDGFLQESINLQWKDGSYRPIPQRLDSGVDRGTFGVNNYIMHKVSDEDVINVLAFIGEFLVWYGTIENGVYASKSGGLYIIDIPLVTDFESLSFTVLNGLIYFMSDSQEFYYRIKYDEINEEYEAKDMYAWKSLIPYYPASGVLDVNFNKAGKTSILSCQCGIIAYRFTLVLKTGEEVLHSPIYGAYMYSLNTYTTSLTKETALENIHTFINTNLEFSDSALFDEEISAINIYASIPFYVKETYKDYSAGFYEENLFNSIDSKGELQSMAEKPFYLVKTLDKPGASATEKGVLFYVGALNPEINYGSDSKVNTDTIAAGSVMPVDNFSYHKVYGNITSNNGRLIISSPKTVLSEGCMRALAVTNTASKQGFKIDTEDGTRTGIAYSVDKGILQFGSSFVCRGILSYPDLSATKVGGSALTTTSIYLYKTRSNKAHNMACSFDFVTMLANSYEVDQDGVDFTFTFNPSANIFYGVADEITTTDPALIDSVKYDSNNRMQLSEFGEFSVWPVANSYRIGEGKILFIGSNSIDPANTDYISPLLIGTSDGIYTANFDPTGANLIQSITRAAKLPAISNKNIVIDQNLIYVSDKGLIIINNGTVANITEPFFPEYGDGDFPDNNTVYPNYNVITSDLSGSDYKISDIVEYMKDAIFAYDARRNNVWCSNVNEDFSLIYNLTTNQWTMSTYVFEEVIDYDAIIKPSINEIYTRYLTIPKDTRRVDILSGEDLTEKVYIHLLTRGIKIDSTDQFKKIERLISRCQIYRDDSLGKFTFGLWGKQDYNKDKISIPLIAYNDNSSTAFPNNIRQDIPIGRMKGKYKVITILQGGFILPKSSIDGFEIVALPVDNNILR